MAIEKIQNHSTYLKHGKIQLYLTLIEIQDCVVFVEIIYSTESKISLNRNETNYLNFYSILMSFPQDWRT